MAPSFFSNQNGFEELHQALVSREGDLRDPKYGLHEFTKLLENVALKTKRRNWNDEDIENIVHETIEKTIDDVYKGKISSSFLGAALSNLKTVCGEYSTIFEHRYRKQVNGDRQWYSSQNESIFADEEEEVPRVYLQRAMGEVPYYRPEEELLKKEWSEVVENAVDPITFNVLEMDLVDGMKQKDIGLELGITPGHVSKIKTRGLQKIKKKLDDY
jgi:RNA polymerase sigma factor (sigma-70 family)